MLKTWHVVEKVINRSKTTFLNASLNIFMYSTTLVDNFDKKSTFWKNTCCLVGKAEQVVSWKQFLSPALIFLK